MIVSATTGTATEASGTGSRGRGSAGTTSARTRVTRREITLASSTDEQSVRTGVGSARTYGHAYEGPTE